MSSTRRIGGSTRRCAACGRHNLFALTNAHSWRNHDKYSPRPEHKFSFGLWTVGNRGRDPFGEAVRPTVPPNDIVALLAEVGAWGVNLHDNDLVPIEATPAERDRIRS